MKQCLELWVEMNWNERVLLDRAEDVSPGWLCDMQV